MTTEIAVRRDDHDDLFRIARAFAASGYFKDSRDEAQCVVRILAGRELGFGAFASMSGIHIIEGKPAVSAGLMATAIENSGRYAYRIQWEPDDLNPTACAITFYRLGGGTPRVGRGGLEVPTRVQTGVSRFSVDDARAAGLWDRAMWKKYTRNMLFSRAMSNGCRWYCAGVFGVGAVYTPEELGADVDADGAPVAPTPPVLHMVDATVHDRSLPPNMPTDMPTAKSNPTRQRSREAPAGKRWSEADLAYFWGNLAALEPRVTAAELHAILAVDSLHDWPDLDTALGAVFAARQRNLAEILAEGDPADEDNGPRQAVDEPFFAAVGGHPPGSVEYEWDRYGLASAAAAEWNRDFPEQAIRYADPPRDAPAPQVRAYADGLERRLAKTGRVMSDYQLLPPLSAEEYAALKADIAARGVLVPVEFDEAGAVLDGHHRLAVWEALRAEGVDVPPYPRVVRTDLSEADKVAHVLALNLARRHLSRDERAALVRRLRALDPETYSYPRLGRDLGIDPKTAWRDVNGTPLANAKAFAPRPELASDEAADAYIARLRLTTDAVVGALQGLPPLSAPPEEQAVMVAIRAASITHFDPVATAAAIPFDVRASHRGAFVSLREWLDRVIAALDADGGIRALPKV